MSSPTPDTEGKPCPDCGGIGKLSLDTTHVVYPPLLLVDCPTCRPAAQPANLADGGELLKQAEHGDLPNGGCPDCGARYLESDFYCAVRLPQLIAAHDQALKSQLLASIGENESNYANYDDWGAKGRGQRDEIRDQLRQAINTVYKGVE